jgi:hypothetical protein
MKNSSVRNFFARVLEYYRSDTFDEHLDWIIQKMKDLGIPGTTIGKFVKIKSRRGKLIYLACVLGVNIASFVLPIELFEKASNLA